jgi:hypothetical protein
MAANDLLDGSHQAEVVDGRRGEGYHQGIEHYHT